MPKKLKHKDTGNTDTQTTQAQSTDGQGTEAQGTEDQSRGEQARPYLENASYPAHRQVLAVGRIGRVLQVGPRLLPTALVFRALGLGALTVSALSLGGLSVGVPGVFVLQLLRHSRCPSIVS